MRITKFEMARWFECIAGDKRIPKEVRSMCADIVKRSGYKFKRKYKAQKREDVRE